MKFLEAGVCEMERSNGRAVSRMGGDEVHEPREVGPPVEPQNRALLAKFCIIINCELKTTDLILPSKQLLRRTSHPLKAPWQCLVSQSR
jgi:hypothetical protein